MRVRETKYRGSRPNAFADRYYNKIVEEGNKLFFRNGGGKISITDLFRRHIGKEIDIDIEENPLFWIISKQSDSGCCDCW